MLMYCHAISSVGKAKGRDPSKWSVYNKVEGKITHTVTKKSYVLSIYNLTYFFVASSFHGFHLA